MTKKMTMTELNDHIHILNSVGLEMHRSGQYEAAEEFKKSLTAISKLAMQYVFDNSTNKSEEE